MEDISEHEPESPEHFFVREVSIRYRGRGLKTPSRISTPPNAVDLARKSIHDDSKEHFLAFYLDARNRPVARTIVSVGTATASLVHPREVFQPAVGIGAVALIVLHNHPSGDPTPSQEDHVVTHRLVDAGKLLGIQVLDHIVWTASRDYYSFREHGTLVGRESA